MGRLFSEDAINNMFDSDSLPCGSKVNSVLGKKSHGKTNTRFVGVRTFDPFEIMDQAVESKDEKLFNRFFQEAEMMSMETLFCAENHAVANSDSFSGSKSDLDGIEDFFNDSVRLRKRYSDRRMLRKPVFVSPCRLRLV